MRTPATLALAILLPCLAHGAEQETLSPYQWAQAQKAAFEKSEKVYTDALKRTGLLSQYRAMRDAYRSDNNRAFRIVFGQYLSWYQSFVGDYVGAHDSYSIRQLPASDDAPSPLKGGYTARPAIEAVAALARGRKAVFFNEAHNVPLTRTLTVELLQKLREDGYDTFAAETIYASDPDLQQRGYPTEKSGFYTMEPICAEMVRTAIKLGYRIVAYESEKEGNGDVREYDQAKNLYERVFKAHPDARLVVNAGYAHIQENGKYLGGRSMAQHFRKLSGIDPLTVEQTMLIEHPPGTENHPYYHAVVDTLHPKTPIVFENAKGEPWTLKPKAYDVSVFFPVDEIRDDRPTWADLDGLRFPYFVNGSVCQNQFPCLVEARYADEGEGAIPADRLVLDPVKGAERLQDRLSLGQAVVHGILYLRPGSYRLTASDDSNRQISKGSVTIGADGKVVRRGSEPRPSCYTGMTQPRGEAAAEPCEQGA
ncbi:hypothetical protein [Dokdonella fugitiva]|uniref:hypothetical protein n=1 Tax=Dokdonella fugitiva TaxID=328517 RepID=UPI0015F78A9D|nr:hypothetical protein [Dokdonella fugitiva]MBA8883799.1 hypothetical protein [Dokdonella fugitiva]